MRGMNIRQITIRIDTVNAAFEDHVRSETARILRQAASKLEDEVCDFPCTLRDIDGNRVGVMDGK